MPGKLVPTRCRHPAPPGYHHLTRALPDPGRGIWDASGPWGPRSPACHDLGRASSPGWSSSGGGASRDRRVAEGPSCESEPSPPGGPTRCEPAARCATFTTSWPLGERGATTNSQPKDRGNGAGARANGKGQGGHAQGHIRSQPATQPGAARAARAQDRAGASGDRAPRRGRGGDLRNGPRRGRGRPSKGTREAREGRTQSVAPFLGHGSASRGEQRFDDGE